jgi:hypothetical protein
MQLQYIAEKGASLNKVVPRPLPKVENPSFYRNGYDLCLPKKILMIQF